ncbi:MAG: peptide chain release factor 2 [Acidobacteriota bacterium]
MSEDARRELSKLQEKVTQIRSYLDAATHRDRVTQLDHQMAEPGFFDDQERAEKLTRERARSADRVAKDDGYAEAVDDCTALLELADEGEDVDESLQETLGKLRSDLARDETEMLLSEPHDAAGAIVALNSGAGGVDAQDWTEMLLRMYMRWCERKGFKAELVGWQAGEEAGIKSATLQVEGEYAYGHFKAESGVHRLIRISPFDAAARRQTAFAALHVFPDVADEIEIDIDEKDLKIDTYRSSGAGGQHVNVTDSAVRITHLPTNIVVTCQNERSQHANKAGAMRVLKAKLFEQEEAKQKAEIEQVAGEKRAIDFGSQIRSYFMHPSQRVKDHRSNHEVGSIDAVLDGDLDGFIQAYLTMPERLESGGA